MLCMNNKSRSIFKIISLTQHHHIQKSSPQSSSITLVRVSKLQRAFKLYMSYLYTYSYSEVKEKQIKTKTFSFLLNKECETWLY